MLISNYLTTKQLEECLRADHALLHEHCKMPQYLLQGGPHSLEGTSLLCSPLPGKAIKLFLSTSPKTLSLRLNPASVLRPNFGSSSNRTRDRPFFLAYLSSKAAQEKQYYNMTSWRRSYMLSTGQVYCRGSYDRSNW